MSVRDDKLSANLDEATALAIAEHLDMLRMKMPNEEIVVVSKSGERKTIENPLWIKVKMLKSRAASDVLNIKRAVDPESMKGKSYDRLKENLDKIRNWVPPVIGTA